MCYMWHVSMWEKMWKTMHHSFLKNTYRTSRRQHQWWTCSFVSSSLCCIHMIGINEKSHSVQYDVKSWLPFKKRTNYDELELSKPNPAQSFWCLCVSVAQDPVKYFAFAFAFLNLTPSYLTFPHTHSNHSEPTCINLKITSSPCWVVNWDWLWWLGD